MPNQMFDQMCRAAEARLSGRDPRKIADCAGATYDPATGLLHISSLGREITVSGTHWTLSPALPGWHHLVLLHYLDLADGTPTTGKEIPLSQMHSGLIRGGGIDRKWELAIQQLPRLSPTTLEDICTALGGTAINTNADAAYRIPFLPRFPVTVKIWFADEDFPASGRLFVDSSADHYLTIEDAVTVAEILLDAFTGAAGIG